MSEVPVVPPAARGSSPAAVRGGGGGGGPWPYSAVGLLGGLQARAAQHVSCQGRKAALRPPQSRILQGPHGDPERPGLLAAGQFQTPRTAEPALPLLRSGSRAAEVTALPSVLPLGPTGPGIAVWTRCSWSGQRRTPAATANSWRAPPARLPPSLSPAARPARESLPRPPPPGPERLTCAEQPG